MLSLEDLPLNPFELFKEWFTEADASDKIQYAAAMCLSTVGPGSFPAGRMVIMQDFSPQGFAFCTDSRSTKGRSLAQTPKAGLTFYWGPFERQVRVQGHVQPGTDEEADRYFQRRPRRSQITAWASKQSRPLKKRKILADQMEALDAKYADQQTIPRPPHWKVYRIVPQTIEFWTARARRLHDRFLYTSSKEDSWQLQRLYP